MTIRLGILGGGQLGAMLAEAADQLNIPCIIASTENEHLAGEPRANTIVKANWEQALAALEDAVDVITWEREDLPLQALKDSSKAVYPYPQTLSQTQDRFHQKSLFDKLGLDTAPWMLGTIGEEHKIVEKLGNSLMVKARIGGFDGRGQIKVDNENELKDALQHFSSTGSIVEQCIPFDSECAALITRGRQGNLAHYPSVMTYQLDGQLSWGLSPHPHAKAIESWMQHAISAIANEIDHVGTLAMECFYTDGKLLINEIAPRVHNSGHGSIEGIASSQFENHVRAVCGLELGSTESVHTTLMINCIGQMPILEASETLSIHDYRKPARAKRKVGHVTLTLPEDNPLSALPAHLFDIFPLKSVSDIA